jgi:hypothetical protein
VKKVCSPRACHENYVQLSGLNVRPAVLEAENVPRVPVVSVVSHGGGLLGSERIVVVVHHHTEVLVDDNTGATGSEDLPVAGEEHGTASLLAILAIGIDLQFVSAGIEQSS